MQKQKSVYVLLLLLTSQILSGCQTSAQKSNINNVDPVNRAEKSTVSSQITQSPTPIISLSPSVSSSSVTNKDANASNNERGEKTLPTDPAPDDLVTEWGKQTGGKTIRVEFAGAKRKNWTENNVGVQAQFTSQSAIYKTFWTRGTTDVYLVNAKADQRLTVKIVVLKNKSVPDSEKDAGFDVFNARTNQRLEGEDKNWSQKLLESGDYAIAVIGGFGNVDYTLEITVK